ncbi:adenosine deaminase family protein [Oleiharenicola lentus]|uniref:adenosine deaminase family protein n=1 Tax=Oleiharenicola lentus TaxID=2508720 RepID=UPI003F675AFA
MKYLLWLAVALSCAHAAPFDQRFEIIKRTANPAELYTLLYALPKGGDIHNHMGGSGLSEWWYEFATNPEKNGGDTFYTRVKFSTPIETGQPLIVYRTIRKYAYAQLADAEKTDYVELSKLTAEQKKGWLDGLRLDRQGEGRHEFFAWIWPRRGQIGQNIHVSTEILVRNLQAFGAEGLRYLETQFGADGYSDNDGKAIPVETAVAFIKSRLARSDAVNSGVTVRFQDTVIRFAADAERSLENTYHFIDANRDLWVGINMAGIEENGKGYPARFLQKYRELRRIFPTLPLSIHAGEMDGPDKHIRDTLLLGASRIGHGVNLIQDPDTLLLMRNNQFLVEVNLISNQLLEYTPDLSKHPFPEYLRTGVPVCLNTDDRGMWDSNLTDEYYTAVTLFNLSWNEIVQLGRNSLAYSFVQPEVKTKLLADYDASVKAFEAKYLPADSLKQLAAVKPVTYGYAKRTWGFEFK